MFLDYGRWFYKMASTDLDVYKNKLNVYTSCSSSMSDVLIALKKMKDELKACEKGFEDGGYLVNGETLDQGKLKKAYEKAQDIIDNLSALSANVKSDIEALNNAIANSIDENSW